jgi:hypothetical protein
MKMAAFKAVCPLEIGDTVAIRRAEKPGETATAYYIPTGAPIILTGTVAIHKITDIATLHYLKSGEVQFMYEIDNSGKYMPLAVKMPIKEYDEALKRRR